MANFFIYNQTINFVINSPPPLPRNNNNNNSSINMIHKIYACVFPSLLALLQIQTSSADSKSPFQLHPLITEASVLGIFGYYLAFVASLRLARYVTQLSVTMAVCGSFSMAWLLALLLPESWWPLRYVFNVMLALLELHQVLVVIYQRFVKRLFFMMIMRMKRSRSSSWWISNSNINSQRNILPLTYTDLRI